MFIGFYDDTVVIDEAGSVLRNTLREALADITKQHPDLDWDLVTVYMLGLIDLDEED